MKELIEDVITTTEIVNSLVSQIKDDTLRRQLATAIGQMRQADIALAESAYKDLSGFVQVVS